MQSDDRPSWDSYFLSIAETVAARADCRRRRVGAVLTKYHRIAATGYNGAPAGQPGCLAGNCPRGLKSYAQLQEHVPYDAGAGRCIALHAEANALLYASREDARGGTMYITAEPCPDCRKLLQAAGVEWAIWPGGQVFFPEPFTPRR